MGPSPYAFETWVTLWCTRPPVMLSAALWSMVYGLWSMVYGHAISALLYWPVPLTPQGQTRTRPRQVLQAPWSDARVAVKAHTAYTRCGTGHTRGVAQGTHEVRGLEAAALPPLLHVNKLRAHSTQSGRQSGCRRAECAELS
jgi:hypothetical protein